MFSSVGAGRSPRRQMRRYLPCGEKCVISLATVANTKMRWSLTVFAVKIAEKTTALPSFFLHKHGFIWFLKFPINLASIFHFFLSINIAIIAYIIVYIQHKLCLFTFSTKNKMADDHNVGLFLWSVHLIIWCCFIHTDHVMLIMSLYHNHCVMSYFVAAFNNLCFTFYYHRAIAMD